MLLVGAFQNCATSPIVAPVVNDTVTSIADPEVREVEREPASANFNELLRSSERELTETHNQLDENLTDEGGFDRAMRGIANSKDSDMKQDEASKEDGSFKIRLKSKKPRR